MKPLPFFTLPFRITYTWAQSSLRFAHGALGIEYGAGYRLVHTYELGLWHATYGVAIIVLLFIIGIQARGNI